MEDLKDCETPFNWDISEQIALDFNEESLLYEQEMSVINILYSIMLTYVYTVKSNYNQAVKNLRDTDSIWSNFDYVIFCTEGISLNLILEVILSTKLYVLYTIEQYDEANKVLSEIKKNKLNKKKINSNTLNGCKAIAWTFFHEKGAEKAILFAKSALGDNPNCSLWHFILGKNLRRLRRSEIWCCNPSAEELQSLVKAHELTNNPLYTIYAAQSYQENLDEEIASSYYIKVFETKPSDCKIQLRLALCFLRSRDLHRAKICLDYVENCCPETVMFYHYKGIYYKKIHNFKLAADYFKKASKESNLGAYIQYGLCMLKIDQDFSYVFHLLNLLKKFETADNTIKQQLLLDVAMEQYHNESYGKALKNFIKGIKLLPFSNILKKYPARFSSIADCDIYEFVNNNLVPKFDKCTEEISEDILNDLKDFKNILKMQIRAQDDKITCTATPLQHSYIDTFKCSIKKVKIMEFLFYKFTSFTKYIWNFFNFINVHAVKKQ